MKLKIILELLYKFKNKIKVFQIASQQSASDIFFVFGLDFCHFMENVALYFCKTHFTSWRLFSLLCILTRLLILSLYFCPFPAPNRVINSSQESWLPFTQIWEFFLLLLILWWSSLSLIPSRNMLFEEIPHYWKK